MKLKISILSLFLISIFLFLSISVAAQGSNALLVEIDGTIDSSTVEILKESFRKAEIENSDNHDQLKK